MAKADTDLQLLSHADQERQLQKLKKRRLHGREEDVRTHSLSCLAFFVVNMLQFLKIFSS